jgi:single-strand DNA-binding protein
MNKAIITGRWTKDPDIKYTGDSLCIARGTIAVNRWGKDNGADFISVVAFGKTAEHIQKYYSKGMKANISGRIQTGSYDGKNGKVHTTDLVIDEIEFGESKGEKKDTEPADFVNIPDEIEKELPFN